MASEMDGVAADLAAGERFGSALRTFATKRETIYVYDDGGVFFCGGRARRKPGSGKTFTIRWSDVRRFVQSVTEKRWAGGTSAIRYDYNFWYGNTVHFVADEVRAGQPAALADFAAVVDPLITRHQLPRMRAELKQGKSIDFKAVTLRPDGLQKLRDVLTWDEIDHVEIGRRVEMSLHATGLVVRAKDRRVRWAAWRPVDIVNRTAFLRLLEHHGVELREAQ